MFFVKRKTIEDYVELVYELEDDEDRVRTNDVASVLDVKPASVTEVFRKLSEEGYVDYKRYNGACLTSKGRRLARRTKKRHDALMDFLTLLGVDEKVAEEDACEMEHILHRDTMDAVVKFVEVIKQCEITPFWLSRLKEYIETGELRECPEELAEVCNKYANSSAKKE